MTEAIFGTLALVGFVFAAMCLPEKIAKATGVNTWVNRNVLLQRAARRWRAIGP